MAGKKQTPENPTEQVEGGESKENLGTLTEQPTVTREPVTTELADGTVRVDY